MNNISSKLVICGITLVVTLISGFLVSNSGKPYNSAFFSVHKLIAIATITLLGISIYNLYKARNMQAIYALIFAATGLLFFTLIVSGSLLSLVDATLLNMEKPMIAATLRIHQIVPILVLLSSAMSLYVLVRYKA